MEAPLLSILIPSVPSRIEKLQKLIAELEVQIGSKGVEVLAFTDNKRRTIGAKRDALLRMAMGKYVAFVDDDDWVSPDYVSSILSALDGVLEAEFPDVITFRQRSVINGVEGEVEFRLGNPNEQFNAGGVTKRNAWHVCAIRRTIAVLSCFPSTSYGEDFAFSEPLQTAIKTEVHIPRVLHHYLHSSETTEAANGMPQLDILTPVQ